MSTVAPARPLISSRFISIWEKKKKNKNRHTKTAEEKYTYSHHNWIWCMRFFFLRADSRHAPWPSICSLLVLIHQKKKMREKMKKTNWSHNRTSSAVVTIPLCIRHFGKVRSAITELCEERETIKFIIISLLLAAQRISHRISEKNVVDCGWHRCRWMYH